MAPLAVQAAVVLFRQSTLVQRQAVQALRVRVSPVQMVRRVVVVAVVELAKREILTV
jgi:hypothetical protein